MADQLTIGVEEEYQLVDADTFALVPAVERVLPRATAALGDEVQPELNQSQIEIGTPVCTTLDEVRDQIVRLRRAVAKAAEAEGRRIVAAATHPFSSWQDQRITHKESYEGLASRYAHLAKEQLLWGCHVHVGVPDAELAIQVMNHARPWLPALLALSSSSPLWQGVDTGYASYRTEVFSRWPTAGPPLVFASRGDYDELMEQLIATDSIDAPARIYWQLRPSAKYETLEFRVADVCTSVDDAVLVAGLARGIAARGVADVGAGRPVPPVRHDVLRAALWRAARNGLTADLVDLAQFRSVNAAEEVRRLLVFIQPAVTEDEWQTLHKLAEALIARGTSAARQRDVLASEGTPVAVVRWLADATTGF
jgi:carboxylate-amine ligase